nr:DDE-type integrase/transposase/recombinase [Nocardia ignorata]
MVNRDFTAGEPDRLWVAGATRIACGEGVFWLAAVQDAFSNRIVGWKCSDRCDAELVLGALEHAVWTRDVRDGQLVHHSDRGSTYTAIRFANRLAYNGIAQPMGVVGDSYDNALMENFLLHPEDRVGLSEQLADKGRRRERHVRLHRRLVQHPVHPEEARLAITRRVRSHLSSPGSCWNQIIRSPD